MHQIFIFTEIGHNLGALHDRGASNACDSTASHYGWRDPQADFRSILAYNCASGQCDGNAGGGCNRVKMFSNRNFLYNNKAIGSSKADNAGQINAVAATVAGYYSVAGCSVDSDCDDNIED